MNSPGWESGTAPLYALMVRRVIFSRVLMSPWKPTGLSMYLCAAFKHIPSLRVCR